MDPFYIKLNAKEPTPNDNYSWESDGKITVVLKKLNRHQYDKFMAAITNAVGTD